MFSGSSHADLTNKVCDRLGIEPGKVGIYLYLLVCLFVCLCVCFKAKVGIDWIICYPAANAMEHTLTLTISGCHKEVLKPGDMC